MSGSPRQVRRAFFAIDFLFRAAWVVWVPTFFVYLTAICGNSPSKATIVIVLMYAIMFALEVTLGALADVLPGTRTFYWSCICNGISYALYAALPLLDWGMGGAIVCEVIGGVGMTLFSGAFERWYQSTLELSGDPDSVTRMFARLRMRRYLTSAVFGVGGILLYQLCLQRGLFEQASPDLVTVLLLPHSFGALFIFIALGVAYTLRRNLTNDAMLLAGGRSDVVSSFGRNIRRAKQAIRDGWRIMIQLPALRGGIYLACAHQLALTVVSFYWPPVILRDLGHFDDTWWRLMWFWLAREMIRALGAWFNLYFKKLSLGRASRFAVLAMTLAGLVFVLAGTTGTLEVTFGVVIALLLGVSEPHIDALVQGHAPPDLRSVMGSYKAMVSSCFCALGLVPIAIVALWKSSQGETYSFGDAVTITGVLVGAVSVFAWKHFHNLAFVGRVR